MTVEVPKVKTPNESLADLVVEKLRATGFIPENKVAEITGKVGSGSATIEDWRLWVDLALTQKQGGNDNGID